MQTVAIRTGVIVGIAVLIAVQAFAFRIVGDIVTSGILVAVGYAYGKWGK